MMCMHDRPATSTINVLYNTSQTVHPHFPSPFLSTRDRAPRAKKEKKQENKKGDKKKILI